MARRVITAFMVCAALLAATATAQAAYTLEPWPDCGAGYNSGSFDDAGELFVPCGNPSTLNVFGADGNLITSTKLSFFISDAAPSPDGAYVYVTSSDIVPRRLNRQPDGTYVLDPVWAPQQYSLYGAVTPHGVFLDTDSLGNIYLADGAWTPNNRHTVVKYAPDGSVITRFGEYTYYSAGDPHSWDLDFFYWMLTGIAAVGDGSTVYTLEGGNDRVQKWVRQGNGSYNATTSYGGSPATDPNREGKCSNGQAFAGTFAAPYDLGQDGAGNFYVINTTCHEVIQFDQNWNYVTDIDVGSETNPSDHWDDGSLKRPHGIAVAQNGNVCIGQSHARLRAAGTPMPCNGMPPATTDPGGGGGTPPPPDGTPPPENKPPIDPVTQQPMADTVAPRLMAAASKRQRVGRTRKLRVSLTCDEVCTGSASVSVRVGKRSFRASSEAVMLTPARPRVLTVTLPRSIVQRLVRALRTRRIDVTVVATAKDSAGNVSPKQRLRIRVAR